jgi:hypothetical protein
LAEGKLLGILLSEFLWSKPVLSLYRENNEQPETEAFGVIKAKKLIISELENGGFSGKIEDFFSLMGDLDQIQPGNKYVVCWFDDSNEDFHAAFRRLSGVTFPTELKYAIDKRNKRTYNATFEAKHAKLK